MASPQKKDNPKPFDRALISYQKSCTVILFSPFATFICAMLFCFGLTNGKSLSLFSLLYVYEASSSLSRADLIFLFAAVLVLAGFAMIFMQAAKGRLPFLLLSASLLGLDTVFGVVILVYKSVGAEFPLVSSWSLFDLYLMLAIHVVFLLGHLVSIWLYKRAKDLLKQEKGIKG